MPKRKILIYKRGENLASQDAKKTKQLKLSSRQNSIKESVYSILMTRREEKWLRPDFKNKIIAHNFMEIHTSMLNIMAKELARDIIDQEPRILDVNIRMNPNEKKACLIVDIEYIIEADNSKDRLTVPIYLTPHMDEKYDID